MLVKSADLLQQQRVDRLAMQNLQCRDEKPDRLLLVLPFRQLRGDDMDQPGQIAWHRGQIKANENPRQSIVDRRLAKREASIRPRLAEQRIGAEFGQFSVRASSASGCSTRPTGRRA
jgi:hypothetical protein